ncbi:MAG: SH3 domain-containing protein [Candidatus Latescibacteria bacterium]|nr:SH3 domain-containing protein [Candidatus Latescibacterota bacterium]
MIKHKQKKISKTILFCSIAVSLCIFLLTPGAVFAEEYPVSAPEALPGTTVEMNSPDFWINRAEEPDKIIMSYSEIKTLNQKNVSRVITTDHPYADNIQQIEKDGPVFIRMNPLETGENYPSKPVRDRLEENITRLNKSTLYDQWELPYKESKKAEIINALNLENVPDILHPKKGILVRHTSTRLYPTAEPGYRMRNYLDDNNVTSLDIGMPVAVMHLSRTGEYCYAMTPIAWGWIPLQDIAFETAVRIETFIDMEKIIVITGHKVPCYTDKSYSVFHGNLYLGERLPIESKSSDGICVTIPDREFDGSLFFRQVWVRAGESVHEGWLPYTKRNVITTAFRLLGRPYGWHDSWDERDCGGIMRVIFNCFGFTLPRYWSFQQLYSDFATHVGDISDMDRKTAILCSMPEGITFTGSTGHIGLYLGNVDGKPYVIHQCGWNYKEGEKEYKMAKVVVSDYVNVGFDMKGLKFFTPLTDIK